MEEEKELIERITNHLQEIKRLGELVSESGDQEALKELIKINSNLKTICKERSEMHKNLAEEIDKELNRSKWEFIKYSPFILLLVVFLGYELYSDESFRVNILIYIFVIILVQIISTKFCKKKTN